jgi:Fe/S biogenesis protein NfuA
MRRRIRKFIDQHINPMVEGHGGRIDLVDYVNRNVYIEMSGGCQGCSASSATLRNGVDRMLREAFGDEIQEIYDVTDHSRGTNPYYA